MKAKLLVRVSALLYLQRLWEGRQLSRGSLLQRSADKKVKKIGHHDGVYVDQVQTSLKGARVGPVTVGKNDDDATLSYSMGYTYMYSVYQYGIDKYQWYITTPFTDSSWSPRFRAPCLKIIIHKIKTVFVSRVQYVTNVGRGWQHQKATKVLLTT